MKIYIRYIKMWSLKYYFIIKRSNFSIMIFDLVTESGNFGEI